MIKKVFSMPENQKVFITDFAGGFKGTIKEFKQKFRRLLQKKISNHINQKGRKYDSDYQRTMYYEGRAINNYLHNRVIERRTLTTDIYVKRYGRHFLLEA